MECRHCLDNAVDLGVVLQGLGRFKEAEASYNQAIAIKPGYAEAYAYLGHTLKEQGRLDEAEASYNQAIALKPDYAEAHEHLGSVLLRSGRYREGINERKKGCGVISFDLENGV